MFVFNILLSEIIYETGSLTEFIGGTCSSCSYDNFISHVSEGIAQEGYNIYTSDTLDIQTNGFGDYNIISNDSDILNYWQLILSNFLNNNFSTVDELLTDSLSSFNYNLISFNDTIYNKNFYMIRENIDSSYIDLNNINNPLDDVTGSFKNGWGLYIINPNALNKQLIIEVPHPNDDFISPYISTKLFLETDAFALLVAGAGREVKWTEQGDYTNDKSKSDPSRNENTVFHEFHKILCDSLVNLGPHSPIVFHMHSFDENDSHADFKSVILSGGYDAEYVNKPIRDVSNDHLDIINFTEEHPVTENQFSSILDHDHVHVNEYYQVHYDSIFYYYGDSLDYQIPHAYELVGPYNAIQMLYLRNYFDNRSSFEPWIQVEMDEKPELFNNSSLDDSDIYSIQYPVTYNNYNIIIDYYTPFINSVKSYLEHWQTQQDTLPPTTINNLSSNFDGFHYVDLNWTPTDDTNFESYKIYFDTDTITENSMFWDKNQIPNLIDVRTNNATIYNLDLDSSYVFAIQSNDVFNNISEFSNIATDMIIGHNDNIVIQNFENDIALNSFPNHDEDPNDWMIDSTESFYNSNSSLKLYGNTWKVEDILDRQIDSGDIWQIASYCEEKGEIIGLAFQDSVNTLYYSFYGSQELDIEEWVTVYQGAFLEDQWNVFKMPIADDWFAYFDYLPLIDKVVYINDKDNSNIESISYFDDLLDITPSTPYTPSVTIEYTIINDRSFFNSRSIEFQFYSYIEDDDSENFNYLWHFGDGNFSEDENPIHNYTINDSHDYNVFLEVVDDDGYTGYATIPIALEYGESSLPVSINFVGDVMLGRKYDNVGGIIDQYGVEYIFEHTIDYFGNNADISVANLECPLTADGPPHPTKSVVFKARPENVNGLTYAGIDIVSLANNHTIDYGIEGLINTQNILDGNNILYSGAGIDSYESYEPLIINKKGLNLAFLASSDRTGQYNNYQPYLHSGYNKPGFAYMTPYYILNQIEAVENIADFIILEMHAGSEYSNSPGQDYDSMIFNNIEADNFLIPDENITQMDIPDISDEDENYSPRLDVPHMWDREIRHFAIDNGADLVIVHHPHIIQGFEIYNEKLIAHSLGNFVFDLSYPETFPSVILNAEINENNINNFIVNPVYIDENIPYMAEGELGLHILDYLAFKSKELNTNISVDRININANVIIDSLSINQTNILSKTPINTYNEDNYIISKPIPIHNIGNFKSVDSLDTNFEYRVGKELIWFGNMEDEGCTLWNLNSQDEYYDYEHQYNGFRSICHIRNENSSDNILTNLQYRIKINDESNYGLYANLKTVNANDARVQIRYYNSRTGSLSLGTDSFENGLNGDNEWTSLYNDINPRDNTSFFDLRLYSDVPDTGISKTWYDDVSVIEWTDWYNIEEYDSLLLPNDYYFLQVRNSSDIENNYLIHTETTFNENLEIVNPNFSIIQTDYTIPSPIEFNDISSGLIGWYLWDFGDGNTSIIKNPIHSYESNGPFTVSLSIIDYNGNILSEIKEDVISFNNTLIDGDLNFDTIINILDIVIMINLVLDSIEDASGILNEIGDLDNNGDVDVIDIVLLVNLALDN